MLVTKIEHMPSESDELVVIAMRPPTLSLVFYNGYGAGYVIQLL